jgi:hypothetical protein
VIDRGIGLQIVVERALHDVPVDSADDIGGHGVVEPERTTDRENLIANPHLITVTKPNER